MIYVKLSPLPGPGGSFRDGLLQNGNAVNSSAPEAALEATSLKTHIPQVAVGAAVGSRIRCRAAFCGGLALLPACVQEESQEAACRVLTLLW